MPWLAICQVQADIRLTGGSAVGFGRLLWFGANVEMVLQVCSEQACLSAIIGCRGK